MPLNPFHYVFAFALGIIWTLFITTSTSLAQVADTTVYTIVEQQPQFPGGLEAMKHYLLTNVQYPSEAKKAGVKARVLISFIIEPDRRMTDVRLLNEIGYGCDEEAMRVVKSMPQWAPGSQSGKPLRVKVTLPVLFGLDYPKPRVR